MRAMVVVLGLALAAGSAPLAAQQPSRVVLHTHVSSPMRRVDFGLKQALAAVVPVQPTVPAPRPQHGHFTVTPAVPIPAQPVDCAMVKTHKHGLLTPATPVVTPPANPKHHLKVVTVPGCPGR